MAAAAGVTDNEIRQIASEPGLAHQDFIAIRSGYRDRLSILKKPDGG